MADSNNTILIVGCGLAGATLAYTLLESGQNIHIISNEAGPSSSAVAAGIYNPITGKKLQKTWLAHELFPYFQEFYGAIQKRFNVQFMEDRPIVRPIESIKEQNFVLEQLEAQNMEAFGAFTHNQYAPNINFTDTFGNFTTKQSGWLNVKLYLTTLKDYFKSLRIFNNETFNYNQLSLLNNIAVYKGITYQKVIFCEGFGNKENPYFNYLKFAYVKGELLDISIPEVNISNEILLKGVFLVPKGNQQYVLGATYQWDNLNFEPTQKAKEQLLKKFTSISNASVIIQKHRAGVRPATSDRRPMLGVHPSYPQLAIFNGMGSKGVSLAPYMALLFKNFLINNIDLLPEININRFQALYLSSEIK
jgi:glycine/D-amino acid oxidase-like deaminating enzyme